MSVVRCAIYTRKSSEEGLEQAFNSLDAQREACAAYILSQASEGWVALPDIYDDGGLSGGTLERPALQRLLAEVSAGRIDTIVVYKVDRLTRSLLDFSKLVEAFDKAGTSFVSVTQSFNTTTSMGRLTLNMLLSFAQFEREVTAERIRDKIAASKAKGMWMGGTPPLGYAPDGRSLKIVEEHAALVRDIYRRYLACGNVRDIAGQLERERMWAPVRHTTAGRAYGGVPLTRGQLYYMLNCGTYVGEVHHRGQVYPGLHPAIIDRDTWDRTQAMLASNVQGHRSGARTASPGLLAGRLVDHTGEPLITTHACKGAARYRYYVSRALHKRDASDGLRLPATEIETAVTARIATLLDDAIGLAATAWLVVQPHDIAAFAERCADLAIDIRRRKRVPVRELVAQVRVHDARIEIDCDTAALATALGVATDDDTPATITLASNIRLTRSGRAMRLVQDGGAKVTATPDRSLIRLIVQARGWWQILRTEQLQVSELAAREGLTRSYVTRVLRVAFLAPAVVDAVLAGRQRDGVTAAALTLGEGIEPLWAEQVTRLLPVAGRAGSKQ